MDAVEVELGRISLSLRDVRERLRVFDEERE